MSTHFDNPMLRAGSITGFERLTSLGPGRAQTLLNSASISTCGSHWQDGYIPYRSLIDLLEGTALRYGLPSLGLQLSELQDVSILGALGVAMKNSATLRESFSIAERHSHFHSPALEVRLEYASSTFEFVSYDIAMAKIPTATQTFELSLAVAHRIASSLAGAAYSPQEVWFMHQPIAPLSEYRRIFGVTPRFKMDRTGLLISKQNLALPISDRDEVVLNLAEYYLRSNQFPSSQISKETRRLVTHLLRTGKCTQDKVASMMGMSARTLQRRLNEESTTFEGILDEVQRGLAKVYLETTDLSVTKVSELLHFTETSAFSRACRRWFGVSPRLVRQAHQNQHAFAGNYMS